jgi:hypothetical protein
LHNERKTFALQLDSQEILLKKFVIRTKYKVRIGGKFNLINQNNYGKLNGLETGIAKLKKNIGFKDKEEIKVPENKKGKVVRKYTNPRIIGVVLDDEPEKEHNVLCRESNKFILNMPVEVRWDGARWCIVRHPRFNGKY